MTVALLWGEMRLSEQLVEDGIRALETLPLWMTTHSTGMQNNGTDYSLSLKYASLTRMQSSPRLLWDLYIARSEEEPPYRESHSDMTAAA